MLHSVKRIFARRAATLPIIGIFAIAATACGGVGLTEARQAVDNQRAINEIEDRELRPIERELDSLYENQILPRERELEDLWNQIQDLENGQIKDAFSNTQDPWAPGGAASVLQQEFNDKYAEIDILYRELEKESRRIQIEQQFDTGSFGIDPAVAALEDERFGIQRELDRLHQFGRRPIEDIYLQMNELNASNGWSQSDIYVADDLNRQIADIQNQISNAQANGAHLFDQNQQELFAIDNELNILRNEGYFPIQELYNRIAELEQQLGVNADGTVAGSTSSTTTDPDVVAQIEQLKADMAAATESLRSQLDELNATLVSITGDAQAEIDALLASGTTTEPADTSALQADIDALNQQVTDKQAEVESAIAVLQSQIDDLGVQIGDIHQETDTSNAALQAQISDLQAEIDALDPEAEDYDDAKAGLEAQIEALQADIDAAIADEAASVAALQDQIDALADQQQTEQDAADSVIADLHSQIEAKQAEIDAANEADSTTSVSQEVLDQIAAVEQSRDETLASTQAAIDDLIAQISEIEQPYLAQISELELSVTVTVVVADTTDIQFEIQTLRDQAVLQENALNEKIRVLEERRNKLQSSLDGSVAGGVDIASLEAKLVLLHNELNALQESGFDASRNYNLLMEELQTKAVELEKQLSLDIRALEDRIWEMDGRIAELYRSQNGSGYDPHARYNERLKQIELDRFELDERRWQLDDEQRVAFDQFNNFGSEQYAEAEAMRAELLDPLYARVSELEDELNELRLTQRDLEDKLRDAQRLVDEQIRELEDQTLQAIEDAVTAAEENADALKAFEDEAIEGLDPALLEGFDSSAIDEVDVTGQPVE